MAVSQQRRSRVLVVDDEASVAGALELILSERGHEVSAAAGVAEALALARARPFDLVFTDLRLPDATGIELLEQLKSETPETEVVLMTAHGSLDVAIEAIKRGAFYYLEKPFTPDQVSMLAERALQFEAVKRENRVLRSTLAADGEDFGIVGHHPKVRQIHAVIRTVAPSDASVIIEGESGTGKELIAEAIHLNSNRRHKPFVKVNLGGISAISSSSSVPPDAASISPRLSRFAPVNAPRR